MDNPILIHAQQIGKTAFGDPRLVKRGRHWMSQFVFLLIYSRLISQQVAYYYAAIGVFLFLMFYCTVQS